MGTKLSGRASSLKLVPNYLLGLSSVVTPWSKEQPKVCNPNSVSSDVFSANNLFSWFCISIKKSSKSHGWVLIVIYLNKKACFQCKKKCISNNYRIIVFNMCVIFFPTEFWGFRVWGQHSFHWRITGRLLPLWTGSKFFIVIKI